MLPGNGFLNRSNFLCMAVKQAVKSQADKKTETAPPIVDRSLETIAHAREICCSLLIGKQPIHMNDEYINEMIKASYAIADAFTAYK